MQSKAWVRACLWSTVLCGCQSVLGIKELPIAAQADAAVSDDAHAGSGGGAGRGETELDDAGKTASPPKVERAGTGGAGSVATAPAAGRAANPEGGSHAAVGGRGGSAPVATERTIHGTIIDHYRHPLAGVNVSAGSKRVTTDAAGKFTLDGVAQRYDITLSYENPPKKYAWRFEDLSRADPTLQVYDGVGGGTAKVTFHAPDIVFGDEASWTEFVVGMSNQDGTFAGFHNATDQTDLFEWTGPSSTQAIIHALRFTRSKPGEKPNGYYGHDEHTVALADGVPVDVQLMLGGAMPAALPTGVLSGTLSGPGVTSRGISIDMLFTDGTVLQFMSDTSVPAAFSYMMPALPNALFIVSAFEGSRVDGDVGFATIRSDAMAFGQPGLALEIPRVVSTVLPAQNATIDAATSFSWNASQVVVLKASVGDARFYVVTTKSQAQLPAAPASLVSLPLASKGAWFVETHGSMTSVDDATSSDGFLEPEGNFDYLSARKGGAYTQSEERAFQTGP